MNRIIAPFPELVLNRFRSLLKVAVAAALPSQINTLLVEPLPELLIVTTLLNILPAELCARYISPVPGLEIESAALKLSGSVFPDKRNPEP